MNKKKILLTTSYLSVVGGVANFNNIILPFLRKKYNVAIIEIGSKYQGGYITPIIDQIKFLFTLIKYNPDLLQINNSLNFRAYMRDALFIKYALSRRIRIVVFIHGWDDTFYNKIAESRFYKKIFDNTYGNVSKILVLSEEYKENLIQLGIEENKIDIFFPSVPKSFIDKVNVEEIKRKMSSIKDIHVLFLARMEVEKGVYIMINAFHNIENKNIKLHIVGKGNKSEEVKEYVRQINDERIIFHGYLNDSDKINILKKCHVYCFPTKHKEGMPVTVLEAMGFGNVIIVPPVGGIKDFFEDYKMGYLIYPDEKNVNKVLLSIIENKDDMLDISLYNHEYVKKHFLDEILINKLYNVYEKVLCK